MKPAGSLGDVVDRPCPRSALIRRFQTLLLLLLRPRIRLCPEPAGHVISNYGNDCHSL